VWRKKEADPRSWETLADHPGHQHELVIVDPNRIGLGRVFRDVVGKTRVDLSVDLELVAFEGSPFWHVVEQRPERGIGVAQVVLARFRLGDRHWNEPALKKRGAHLLKRPVSQVADPKAVAILVYGTECRDQSATAARDFGTTCSAAPHRHGQTVGDEDESTHGYPPLLSVGGSRRELRRRGDA